MTDVTAFVDEQPIGSFQIRLLLACAAVLLLDGFDTQGIGYVAPELAHDWNLARGGLGPVFSAGLVGNMVGTLLFGPLADRIGRKRIIVLSTAVFGLGTLATVFAQDIAGLLLIRFLTGLGLGAALPNAIALVSEFSPDRRRATMVMAMFVGFSVGSALSGLIAAALIPIFGWRSVFLIGGIAPLLMVPFLAARLPESVRFLALSGRADVRVAELLTQVAPSVRFPSAMRFRVREATLVGLPIAYLFNGGRALATLVLWAVFFMSLLDLYLLLNWLPTVLNDLGASVSVAAVVGAMLQVGGIVGTLTLGRFIDRFSFRALSLAFLIAAIAIAIVGFCGQSIAFAIFAISCAGFFLVGGHIAAIALAATYYPTIALNRSRLGNRLWPDRIDRGAVNRWNHARPRRGRAIAVHRGGGAGVGGERRRARARSYGAEHIRNGFKHAPGGCSAASRRRGNLQQKKRPTLLTTFGDPRLRLNFNDVPPYRFRSLLPLGRKVLPGFGLEKCPGGVCTVPLSHGYANGGRLALCVEDPPFQGAHGASTGVGQRLPGSSEVARRHCRTANRDDLTNTIGFQPGLRLQPLDRQATDCDTGEQRQ
nr:MFS transporter [Bradyrhizobium sp. Bra78]